MLPLVFLLSLVAGVAAVVVAVAVVAAGVVAAAAVAAGVVAAAAVAAAVVAAAVVAAAVVAAAVVAAAVVAAVVLVFLFPLFFLKKGSKLKTRDPITDQKRITERANEQALFPEIKNGLDG